MNSAEKRYLNRLVALFFLGRGEATNFHSTIFYESKYLNTFDDALSLYLLWKRDIFSFLWRKT